MVCYTVGDKNYGKDVIMSLLEKRIQITSFWHNIKIKRHIYSYNKFVRNIYAYTFPVS